MSEFEDKHPEEFRELDENVEADVELFHHHVGEVVNFLTDAEQPISTEELYRRYNGALRIYLGHHAAKHSIYDASAEKES